MAGTIVTTEISGGEFEEVKFAWTSSAGGAADATSVKVYSGRVLECVIVPAGGATTPSDLFDVAITDQDGIDVLHGQGANCSNAATSVVGSGLGVSVNSALTLAVTNAGGAKTGTVILHIGV